MKIIPVFLGSPRYYNSKEKFLCNANKLQGMLQKADRKINLLGDPIYIFEQEDLFSFSEKIGSATILLFPLSGGTQRWALSIARKQENVWIWMYYPNDNLFSNEVEEVITDVVAKNAVPSSMDIAAYLKNRNKFITRIHDYESYCSEARELLNLEKFQNSRILLVGHTEQWVVTSSVNERKLFDTFGIEIIHVGIEELMLQYEKVGLKAEEEHYCKTFIDHASRCTNVSLSQIKDVYRVYKVLKNMLKKYDCNSLTIACFSLIKWYGISPCLALSWLNDEDHIIAACEGDLDATISMLIGKIVTGQTIFQGNPIFNLNDTVNIVHCTAGRKISGALTEKYELDSHHETQQGVAIRVEVSTESVATIFRVGNEFSEATLYTGILIDNPRQKTCRTQFRFKIDSSSKRVDQLLGNHTMVVFGDYEHVLKKFLIRLGIRIK